MLASTVGDVIVRRPTTMPPDLTVAEARTAFEDGHVHMLLVTGPGGRLLGTLVRADLPADASGAAQAMTHATLAGRTVPADAPADEVRLSMLARGQRRLAVVDEDGRLLGLLCLNRRGTRFCSDEDVAARAADGHLAMPDRRRQSSSLTS